MTAIANGVGGISFAVGGAFVFTDVWVALALLAVGLVSAVFTPMVVALSTIEAEAHSAKFEERRRALAMFVEFTHKLIDIDRVHDLRVTLLEVDKSSNPARLKQVARCCCTGTRKPGETTMYVNQGVAGRCYLTVKNVSANFEDGDFIEQMLGFGFSDKEARQFQPRKAYLCSPVVDGDREVIAVLSLDALNPNVFTPGHAEATEWVTPFFARFLMEPESGEVQHV